MQRFKLSWLTTTLLFIAFSINGIAQFSFKPKRTNLVIQFSTETGWKLTNTLNTQTYAQFKDENAYVQIINNELRVYTMSAELWNSHPNSTLMNLINIKYTSVVTDTGSTWFDPFSSFWISSSGGHLRIFKYYETINSRNSHGNKVTYTNHFIENHLFLNQFKHSEITSTSTIFMVSPKGNIFEIDKNTNIWRFILKNRTLTAWTSEPPTEKMLFHIFKPEDFKKIIPLGSKDGKFLFQVVNHQNKMGLASITKDFFQVIIQVPPIFDFISPSLNSDFNLIFNNNKLGVLYYLPKKDEDEIREFKSFYTSSKTKVSVSLGKNKSGVLLADGEPFTVTKNGITKSSADFETNINYGLEIIENNLLLYTDYNTTLNIHNSGLYKIAQQNWYIKPKNELIVKYPTSILKVDNLGTSKPLSYSVCTPNGFLKITKVTDLNTPQFFIAASLLTDLPIDSIVPIPEYDESTYKFLSNEKWGLMTIKNESINVVLPAEFDWIQHFGEKKSLLLTNQNQFGWYGIDYCSTTNLPFYIKPKSSFFKLYSGNSINPNIKCNQKNNGFYSAQSFNDYYIYNTRKETGNNDLHSAWIKEYLNEKPILNSEKIIIVSSHFNVTQNGHMAIYNRNLKPLEFNNYDSVLVSKSNTILYDTDNQIINKTETSPSAKSPTIIAAFYQGKPLKSINKYQTKYYNGEFFIVQKDDVWLVLNPNGKPTTKNNFANKLAAYIFVNSLK